MKGNHISEIHPFSTETNIFAPNNGWLEDDSFPFGGKRLPGWCELLVSTAFSGEKKGSTKTHPVASWFMHEKKQTRPDTASIYGCLMLLMIRSFSHYL